MGPRQPGRATRRSRFDGCRAGDLSPSEAPRGAALHQDPAQLVARPGLVADRDPWPRLARHPLDIRRDARGGGRLSREAPATLRRAAPAGRSAAQLSGVRGNWHARRVRLLRRVRGAPAIRVRGDSVTGEEPLVLVERDERRRVALVRLNRPRQLNALNGEVMDQLCDALEALDRDDAIRCLVVTGNERAFAAGADIAEMASATPVEMLRTNRIAQWDRVRRISK